MPAAKANRRSISTAIFEKHPSQPTVCAIGRLNVDTAAPTGCLLIRKSGHGPRQNGKTIHQITFVCILFKRMADAAN